jgi:hypothetical protein
MVIAERKGHPLVDQPEQSGRYQPEEGFVGQGCLYFGQRMAKANAARCWRGLFGHMAMLAQC